MASSCEPTMTERRSASLLDFAITATIAVVPIMLAVLLLAGVMRPAGGAGGHARAQPGRSLRERAPCRRAQDLRVRHPRARRRGARGAERCRGPRWHPA